MVFRVRGLGRLTRVVVCLVVLNVVAEIGVVGSAKSQPVPVPDTYGGDILSRPRLTGDWGGVRDDLTKKGIVLDVDHVMIVQDIVAGGRENGANFNGVGDYILNFNSGKAGLWPGGFLRIHVQNSYGRGVLQKSNSITPVNAAAFFPEANEAVLAVPNLTVMQFLSPWAGVYLGKIYTPVGGDANEFADFDRNQFLNLGLEINQSAALIPPSAIGGGVVLLPWDGAVVNFGVVDPNGETTKSGLDDPFKDGVMLLGEGRVAVHPFDLAGHQLFGFSWTNKDYVSLEQDPSNLGRLFLTERFPRLNDPGPALRAILARFFPGLLVPVAPLNFAHEAWNVSYNFDQFVWSPSDKPDAGVGLFGRFGVSDGKANPIKYHFSFGIGGKNIVPRRPKDSFGVGWSRVEFSDDLAPILRNSLNLGLEHEDAVELYYNFAVTEWLKLTADLQVIDPGLKKRLNSTGALENMDTEVILGLRTYLRF